eukprot:6316357-Ditylum_brightwellii.AAC.1
MHVSLFNENVERDVGLSICTDPYDPSQVLGIHDQERGLFIPMVQCGNLVGFCCYKPDHDDVAISSGSKNNIYLHPDIEFSPDIINKELAIILASAYF